MQPIGFVGASLFARKDLSFDLNWTRSAITYTPLSVHLGVIAEIVEGRMNYFPSPRTELHLTYFSGGIGLGQIDQGKALTRALSLSPAFTLRLSPRLSLRLGYTHYDSAPTPGKVNGNPVLISTDYKF